ncbi:MAG: class I SAM-dependent methyltransferase [Bacteroidetes bacterium]|nr:class I SAM-dependent methyltransferase [Bacteroidota bacterium]
MTRFINFICFAMFLGIAISCSSTMNELKMQKTPYDDEKSSNIDNEDNKLTNFISNSKNLYLDQWQAATNGKKIPIVSNEPQVESFNHHKVRQIMAHLRNSEHHHTGDEYILDKINSKMPNNKFLRMLSVGSGLGETPNYFTENKFTKVTSLDSNYSNIKYATSKYPQVEFLCGDIQNYDKFTKNNTFDYICILNKFARFKDQIKALKTLRTISKKGTNLFIYDFRDLTPKGKNPLITKGTKINFSPIRLDNIEYILNNAGWKLKEIEITDDLFKEWYQYILSMVEFKNESLEKLYPTASHYVYGKYSVINEALKYDILGGCLITAEAI